MDEARCTRCSGEGILTHYSHRIWQAIPGGCYGCDGVGTREAQIANRISHLRGKWETATPDYRARLACEGLTLQAEYTAITGSRF